MKEYKESGVEVKLHPFLTSTVHQGEWSVSASDTFTSVVMVINTEVGQM
jgi:hypothetical protein